MGSIAADCFSVCVLSEQRVHGCRRVEVHVVHAALAQDALGEIVGLGRLHSDAHIHHHVLRYAAHLFPHSTNIVRKAIAINVIFFIR